MTPTSASVEGRREAIEAKGQTYLARQSFPDYHSFVHERAFYRHQLDWSQALQDPQQPRVLITAPPESYKSSTVRPFLEWAIGNRPDIRILLIMNTATQAQKQVMSIAETIERNPRYRQVFPHIKPNPKRGWSHELLFVKRTNESLPDPTLYGTGIDGPYQGWHGDMIVVDDPTDQQDVTSSATMEAQRERVRGVLLDRLVEGGKFFVIMTRWGIQDLVPEFAKMGFRIIENPVKGSYPWGPLLCPETFPQERIDKLLTDKGQSLFDLTYMCDPQAAAKEKSFFDPMATTAMLDDCMEPREVRGGLIKIWRKPVVAGKYIGFSDPAWGQKGSYSLFVVADFQTGEQMAEIHGRPTPDEAGLFIFNLATEYNRAYIGNEDNGEGHQVTKKLIELGYGDRMFHRGEDWRTNEKHQGYLTDGSNRPVHLADLEEAVRLRRIIPRCRTCVGEFMSFLRQGKDNRPDAAEGAYSEAVSAWKGLWAIRPSARFSVGPGLTNRRREVVKVHGRW